MNADIVSVIFLGIIGYVLNAYLITGGFSDYHGKTFIKNLGDAKMRKWYLILAAFTTAICIYGYVLYQWSTNFISFFLMISFIVSITPQDIKEHTIRNAPIAIYFILMFILKLSLWDWAEWLDCVLGFGAGVATLGIAYLIKRSTVGLGDIKVIGVLGFMCGFAGIVNLMLRAFVILLVFSIVLLIRRKVTMQSELPFAPFLFVAALI